MNTAARAQWSLTAVRLITGVVFIAHGSQKVVGFFGGQGLTSFVTWLHSLGVPTYLGYAAALSELAAGVFLLFGIYAEVGAILGAALMIGAWYLVHRPHGFFIQHNGFEYTLTLLVCCIALLIGGPGKLSLLRLKR